MVQEKDVDKLGASGLFKNNLSFELRVRQHCQSKGKSAVQLVNGRGIIHLICLQQMREIRKVRLQNKGIPKEDRVKPTKKCSASFRAVKRKGVAVVPAAKTGICQLDDDQFLPDIMYSNDGYTECTV